MKDAPIFSPGSTFRDVPDHVRGITPQEFHARDLKAQCDAWLKTLAGLKQGIVPAGLSEKFVRIWTAQAKDPVLFKLREHGPRDDYG